MKTFTSNYLQPATESIGQEALAHIRKVHDMKKRVSGEGLASNSASAFQEQLASIESRAAAALAPQSSKEAAALAPKASESVQSSMLDAFPWKAEQPLKRMQDSIQEAPQAKRQCTSLDGVKMLLENHQQHELLMAKSHHALQSRILELFGNIPSITE